MMISTATRWSARATAAGGREAGEPCGEEEQPPGPSAASGRVGLSAMVMITGITTTTANEMYVPAIRRVV